MNPAPAPTTQKARTRARRQRALAIAAAGGIGLLGLVLQVSGSPGWLALGSLLITIAALAYQIELARRYWERSISEGASG